ncbi:MAG TPA: PIN domain-containing protein [Dehalococcoidia bacterium]|nr:PIN domain-containing protein [Dehalococcoidia bacterium]
MKYHLDTSVLIDWERDEPTLAKLRLEIAGGLHDVTIDAIVETEFLASRQLGPVQRLTFESITRISRRAPITRRASELAASWLAPMDRAQRRARFADAIIAAVSHLAGATLLTTDSGIASTFPVRVQAY